MSLSERLAIVNKIVDESNDQITKHPKSIKDNVIREKIGTFAAGAMSDSTPFVSLDRWCWADFYEATNHLSDKNESAAAESALDWKVCLEASFPGRVDLAKPYFSCFTSGPKKSKPEAK